MADGRQWVNRIARLRRRATPWIAALGVVLIIKGQWEWFQHLDTVRPGGIPVLIGLILLLVSIRTNGIVLHPTPVFDLSVRRRLPLTRKLPFALAGIALCFYTAWRANEESALVWDIFILWGLSIWLTIFGLVPRDQMAAWSHRIGESVRRERWTWLLLGVLFLAGLAIRVIDLNHQPYIMAGDEAQFAWEAVSVKDTLHWIYNPFQMGLWHHPRIVHTLMAISIALFGQTAAAARLPWAVLGALTVPAVYLAGRRLFDSRLGWVAALFMATFPVHVMFSRTAMDMTGDPLFVVLAVAFTTRALRDGDLMEAALAGLCLGLSQYFYFAGRIAGPVMVAYVGLHMLRGWRPFWQRVGVLVVEVSVCLVVIFPNSYALIRDTARPFSPRLDQVSIWKTDELERAEARGDLVPFLVGQVKHGFLAYVHFHDESDVYGRYNPVLGWYAGVPLLVGLIVVLRRWRDPRFLIPALWAAGTALTGGALLIDPPHYPRYINPTPALALLVGLGTTQLALLAGDWGGSLAGGFAHLGRLRRAIPERIEAWAGILSRQKPLLPVAFALVLMLANGRSFIFDYLPATEQRHLLYGETTLELNEIVDILRSFQGQYEVRRFSSLDLDMNGTDLLRYLAPENAGTELSADDPAQWQRELTPGPYAFVITPGRFDAVGEELVRRFPYGEMRQYTNRRTLKPLIYVYYTHVPVRLAESE